MRGETKITKQITLHMDGDEAEWLKGVMQNPLDGMDPCEESLMDKTHRKGIFEVLKEQLSSSTTGESQ